jgi:hypothetical protein
MPGHTAYQAAVIVEEDGVVFTSDNIFCKVHTWLQEADPTLLAQGARIAARAARGHVRAGHGRSATSAISTSRVLHPRMGGLRVRSRRAGDDERSVRADLTAMTDRYPMDVGQNGMAPMVMKMNVANLYDFVTGAGIHRKKLNEACAYGHDADLRARQSERAARGWLLHAHKGRDGMTWPRA